MNIIHYMHDKYYYEKAQMAFVDTDPRINLAYGVAGLSIAIDSLSAIKYATVTPRRNAEGLTEGFDIEGDFPCFGNNDDKVDHLGVDLVYYFSEELKKLPVYKMCIRDSTSIDKSLYRNHPMWALSLIHICSTSATTPTSRSMRRAYAAPGRAEPTCSSTTRRRISSIATRCLNNH